MIEASGITKTEGKNKIVNNISFHQPAFQKLAIAGATGSGKTTLLKIIAGHIAPDEGTVFLHSERIKGPDEKLIAGHPSIAYLSQHFELRNHYRVEELLAMATKLNETDALEVYHICRIDHLLKRWTHQLSGGEKQRIALAVLLVAAPKLLLLDEPFSNLDPFHKVILKKVITDVCERRQTSCILVSHEPADTLSWADEIMVMEKGEQVQKDKPQTIYNNPASEYVAALFGRYNLLSPVLQNLFKVDVNTTTQPVLLRPEKFQLVEKGGGVEGIVNRTNFMGSFVEMEVLIAGQPIVVTTATPKEKGEIVHLRLNA